MEPSSQSRGGRGLWSNPRATQYSKETQDLLTLMMQESRLTNLQRKQINDCLKRDLEKEKRRLQSILATGEEEPTAASYQNVPTCRNPGAAEGRDRYQEVLDEIKDRRQFLEDMTSLGQEKQYISIINTEISQRLRELEELDKARSAKMDAMTSEGKGVTPQQTTEKMDLKETHCH
ncbi:UPF0193 protein EVG1 isoform X3 [Micropterus dolomieu]|uniref:UPF0193 protein EVG1 isoform X3 n=1 Tax=Micropterus dolomieu TaxID=147949 RepID=UPI001E8E1DCF|nr:UPF0193 protein EVG1 isoform X3 [Micropterus dolomieu]